MAGRVGKYLMFEILGEGAFGKVKLGVHEETGDQVAIKIMDKSNIREAEMTMNVRREIAIMKALKHRHIVNMHEVLSSKTKLYIVMDLVSGGELFTKILNEGKLEEDQARRFFQQMVDGVEYCHRRGICHRDLKPENLLIDDYTGDLKITDFGLSAVLKVDTAEDLLHTQCGSPNYVAPEVIAASQKGYNGTKVDTWSCGVILYALLTGYLPFFADSTAALYRQIQQDTVVYPDGFPDGARDLVDSMLRKIPEKRVSLLEVKRHQWFRENYEGDDPQISTAHRPVRKKKKKQSTKQDKQISHKNPSAPELQTPCPEEAPTPSTPESQALRESELHSKTHERTSTPLGDVTARPSMQKGEEEENKTRQQNVAEESALKDGVDEARDDTGSARFMTLEIIANGPERNAEQDISANDELLESKNAARNQSAESLNTRLIAVTEEDQLISDGAGGDKSESRRLDFAESESHEHSQGSSLAQKTSESDAKHWSDLEDIGTGPVTGECTSTDNALSHAGQKEANLCQLQESEQHLGHESSSNSTKTSVDSASQMYAEDQTSTPGLEITEALEPSTAIDVRLHSAGARESKNPSVTSPLCSTAPGLTCLPQLTLAGEILSTDGEQGNMFEDASQLDEDSDREARDDARSESEQESFCPSPGMNQGLSFRRSSRCSEVSACSRTVSRLNLSARVCSDSSDAGTESSNTSDGISKTTSTAVEELHQELRKQMSFTNRTLSDRDVPGNKTVQPTKETKLGTSIFKPVDSTLLRKFSSHLPVNFVFEEQQRQKDVPCTDEERSCGAGRRNSFSPTDVDAEVDGNEQLNDGIKFDPPKAECSLVSPMTPRDESQSVGSGDELRLRLEKVALKYKAVFQLHPDGRLMGSRSFVRMSMMSLNTLVLQGKAVSASWYARINQDLESWPSHPLGDINEAQLAAFENLMDFWEVRARESRARGFKDWWSDPFPLTDAEKHTLTGLLALLEVQSVEDETLESIAEDSAEQVEDESESIGKDRHPAPRDSDDQGTTETEDSFNNSSLLDTFLRDPVRRGGRAEPENGAADSSYSSTEPSADTAASSGVGRFKPRPNTKPGFATRMFGWKRSAGTSMAGSLSVGGLTRSQSGQRSYSFESPKSPTDCLSEIAKFYMDKGEVVKKKRFEIRVDIARVRGTEPLQVVWTATSACSGDVSKVLLKRAKYDRSKADMEELRVTFEEVQTAFTGDPKGLV